MTVRRPAFSGALAALGLLLATLPAPPALAGPGQPHRGAPTAVRIDVQVISASTARGPTDPRLLRLKSRLSQFAFASYRLVSEKSVVLRLRSEEVLPLPGHRSLEIVPRRFEASGRLRVHLHLNGERNEKLIDADDAVEPGGDLLVGGPRVGNTTLLVFIHHGG